MEDEILTASQVATLLKMDERTIYKLSKGGEIPSFKVCNHWRFLKTDIQKWVEQKKSEILSSAK